MNESMPESWQARELKGLNTPNPTKNLIPAEIFSCAGPRRIRPWQREGFSSKKEWSLMRKRIKNLIWKNREVA